MNWGRVTTLTLALLSWVLLALAYWTVVRADDGEIAKMTETGKAQWQSVSGVRFGPVVVHVAPLLPPVYYEGQPAQTWIRESGCEVRLDPVFWSAMSDYWKQNVITHELAHCIGLPHGDQPGLLSAPLFYGFTDYDGQVARQYWPYPYNVRAINASTDR